MVEHEVNVPDGCSYRYSEKSSLDSYDLARLEKFGVEEVWYWYVQDSYDGDGELVARVEDMYYFHSLGHCSCYGPVDNFDLNCPILIEEISNFKASSEYKNRNRTILDSIVKGQTCD